MSVDFFDFLAQPYFYSLITSERSQRDLEKWPIDRFWLKLVSIKVSFRSFEVSGWLGLIQMVSILFFLG